MSDQPKRISTIDVRNIFYSKNPRLASFIPGFVFNYLKRIVHQDFYNGLIIRHGEKRNVEFIEACIKEFDVTIETIGEDKLPVNGKYIFAANHPLGGFDALVLIKILSHHFPRIRYLVNDILMNLYNINELFIPVNKHGSLAVDTVKLLDDALISDAQILTFPSGLVSRKINKQIMDLPWKKNFIIKAVRHKRDIIPVHFSGSNSNFFYNLSNFRKLLGIKANIEMLYLPDETFKHSHKHLTVRFGNPISWQTFDNSRKPAEWAKWVKDQVYALDGIYSVPL
jgi:1-acyl-sn-glycerol-3-phosphate acyltransferase